jgi:hypothetical protein
MSEHDPRDRSSLDPDDPDGGCKTTETWDEFCEELRQAGSVLLRAGAPRDELTQAEGHRYLVRMIRAGFENAFDLADPLHPQLAPMVGPRLLYEGVTRGVPADRLCLPATGRWPWPAGADTQRQRGQLDLQQGKPP